MKGIGHGGMTTVEDGTRIAAEIGIGWGHLNRVVFFNALRKGVWD